MSFLNFSSPRMWGEEASGSTSSCSQLWYSDSAAVASSLAPFRSLTAASGTLPSTDCTMISRKAGVIPADSMAISVQSLTGRVILVRTSSRYRGEPSSLLVMAWTRVVSGAKSRVKSGKSASPTPSAPPGSDSQNLISSK